MFSFLGVLVPILTSWAQSAAPALTRKLFGESVDDQVKLEQSVVERLTALASLDHPYGTPSQWVVDLRGSFRYVSAATLILGGLGLAGFGAYGANPLFVAAGIDLAASPFSFIFGERLVLTFKGGPK